MNRNDHHYYPFIHPKFEIFVVEKSLYKKLFKQETFVIFLIKKKKLNTKVHSKQKLYLKIKINKKKFLTHFRGWKLANEGRLSLQKLKFLKMLYRSCRYHLLLFIIARSIRI